MTQPIHIIKFDGVEGESTAQGPQGRDRSRCRGAGASPTPARSAAAAARGTGKAIPGDFHFVHMYDKASPVLAKHCAIGQALHDGDADGAQGRRRPEGLPRRHHEGGLHHARPARRRSAAATSMEQRGAAATRTSSSTTRRRTTRARSAARSSSAGTSRRPRLADVARPKAQHAAKVRRAMVTSAAKPAPAAPVRTSS